MEQKSRNTRKWNAAGLLSCARWGEAAVMTAPAFVGLAAAAGPATFSRPGTIVLFSAAVFLLMAFIFCLNDWSEAAADARDPDKAERASSGRRPPPRWMLSLAVLLALGGLGAAAALSPTHVLLGGAMVLLGVLYSAPGFRPGWKGAPFLSSGLHFAGIVLTFLFGYALASAIDLRGAAVGAYFGIIFVAGHLVQEVQDYSGDLLNGIRTHAVVFGKAPVFAFAFGLFTLGFGYLFWLGRAGLLPSSLQGALLFYPVLAAMFWLTAKAGLDHPRVRRLRAGYRLLHLAIAFLIGLTEILPR